MKTEMHTATRCGMAKHCTCGNFCGAAKHGREAADKDVGSKV